MIVDVVDVVDVLEVEQEQEQEQEVNTSSVFILSSSLEKQRFLILSLHSDGFYHLVTSASTNSEAKDILVSLSCADENKPIPLDNFLILKAISPKLSISFEE